MSIFKTFDYILANLKPSQYRKYYREYKESEHYEDIEKIYSKLFKGKERIVLFKDHPIEINEDHIESIYFDNNRDKYLAMEFSICIEKLAREYFKDKNPKEYKAVNDHLEKIEKLQHSSDPNVIWDNFINYLEIGMYKYFTEKRVIRLIKFLQQVKRIIPNTKDIGLKYSYEQLSQIFDSRKTVKSGEKVIVVISRHPYDILGMSTGRKAWDSCLNIDYGERREYISPMLKTGVLIAYLCKYKDENIEQPLGRILIKPFFKKKDRGMNYKNPNWLLKVSAPYGIFYKDIANTVQEWLDEHWNKYIYDSGEDYVLEDHNVYRDPEDTDIMSNNEERNKEMEVRSRNFSIDFENFAYLYFKLKKDIPEAEAIKEYMSDKNNKYIDYLSSREYAYRTKNKKIPIEEIFNFIMNNNIVQYMNPRLADKFDKAIETYEGLDLEEVDDRDFLY